MKKALKVFLTLAIITPARPLPVFAGRSVYGADDRLDYFAAGADMQRLAGSVVSLWESGKVTRKPGSSAVSLKTVPFGYIYNLCPGEPFRDQPTGAFCSGSLVGDDMVITAGHCIANEDKCLDTRIIFGFAVTAPGSDAVTKVPQSEVYSCKKIVQRFLGTEAGANVPVGHDVGTDYALIQLDRKVLNHPPLQVNRAQQLVNGTGLVIIGHPAGLPLKVAGNASVRRSFRVGYFTADLDAFCGNSGSPVFNASTLLVEGILTRSGGDFITSPAGCAITATYPQAGGRGEDATRISVLQSFIPRLPVEGPAPVDPGANDVTVDISTGAPADITGRFNLNFQ